MNLVSIYAAAGQLEAEMIKSFLESQGIEVILNQESVGRTMGLSAGRLGQVHILVSESQSKEAESYLKDMIEGKYVDSSENDSDVPSEFDESL